MKQEKILDIMKGKNVVIPLNLYKFYKKLGIDSETFIFLMYLNGLSTELLFDINKFSADFGTTPKEVLRYVSLLKEKDLINIKVVKNEKNVTEEYISLDRFFEKIATYFIEDINNEITKEYNVYSLLESELGKPLSPMQYEIVKAWQDMNYSEEMVKEAVKEAVFNGVPELRYIDKILYEWGKKGIKTREDVVKNKKEYQNKKEVEKIDIFDYDWMDEEREN